MITMLSTLNVHEYSTGKKTIRVGQVFVSFCDGLIYEIRSNGELENIVYRKKQISRLDLVAGGLTSFLNFLDSNF